MMQGRIEADELQWFAVRMKRPQNPNRRTTVIGADREAYSDRQGRARVRAVTGTGKRVFIHELLLTRAGFEVFLPVKKVWRRKNRFSPEKHLVAYPLLADWIFVGWPADQCRWADLMALDIVSGVMGTGGRPIRLAHYAVCDLMHKMGGGRLDPEHYRYMRSHAEFDPGDRARVVAGPLDGTELRVIEIDGPMVKGVIDAMGSKVPVEIRADLLEPWE